ncbi:hypothetical protein BSKO_08710 [Bryopsis sp. KO-2023]|nr:hypothetical protein BSKO_08710 [Bryopsis sp. KO-2023]
MAEMSNILKEIEKGNASAVKRLLAVNPNCVLVVNGGEDKTPLHVAASLGHAEIVKVLLSHEAKYEAQDKYGNTALHLACESGSVETVRSLLGAGKKVTLRTRNRDGQTPLHMAIKLGGSEMVKELVAAGARVDVKNKDGLTAFDLVPEERQDLQDALASDHGVKNARSSPLGVAPRLSPGARVSPKFGEKSSPVGLKRTQTTPDNRSPERTGFQRSETAPIRRRAEGNAQKGPKKQMALQEQSIQKLKEELQELGGRLDSIQEYIHEKKEAIDCSEKVFVQVESHDRQLAELDQRLAFQESHLRDLRPQVGHLGDESRLNREQYQHMKQMVDMWRESVRSSLERVLDRVKEWEGVSAKWSGENVSQSTQPASPHTPQPAVQQPVPSVDESVIDDIMDQVRKLEQELFSTRESIATVQSSVAANSGFSSKFEEHLAEVSLRISRLETAALEKTPEPATPSDAGVSSVGEQQIKEMHLKVDRLEVQLAKTTLRTDRVEEMFDEQLKLERSRKAEQDRELSQRESKILDLRRAVLEDEQQRRELFNAHEGQRNKMRVMEDRIEALLANVEKQAAAGNVGEKIKEMETQIREMEAQIAEQSQQLAEIPKTREGCCVIS